MGWGEAVAGDAGRGCKGRGESIGCWLHLPILACPSPPPKSCTSPAPSQSPLHKCCCPVHRRTTQPSFSMRSPWVNLAFGGTHGDLRLAPRMLCFALSVSPGGVAGPTARATAGAHHPVLQVGSSPHLSCHPQSLSLAGCCKPSWGGRDVPPQHESRKEGGASGLPPLMARSVVCRWGACAIRGELVSPPTALQLPEDGLGWHTMCHCPGSWCV